jgi:hypothetical protein
MARGAERARVLGVRRHRAASGTEAAGAAIAAAGNANAVSFERGRAPHQRLEVHSSGIKTALSQGHGFGVKLEAR